MIKKIFTSCLIIVAGFSAISQTTTWSVKFSNAIIGRYHPTINAMTNKGWEYSNGIILVGIEKVYKQTHTASYLNYIKAYVDAYVSSTGVVNSQITTRLGLDGLHPGLLCLFLYEQTGLSKYKLAAQHLRDTLMGPAFNYPKTPEGGYWHRNDAVNFKNAELLDGIYMAQPFLAKYGALFNDHAATDTAVNQAIMLYNHLYSNTTHLIKHAWDYDKNTYAWAVPSTGLSTEVWSRGIGWYTMALIEILRYLPRTHPKYNQLVTILGNLATGIKTYQDATSGLWFDIVDSPKTAKNNYIETSGSGMFIYTLRTAIDSGWLSSTSYLPVVNKAWTGYQAFIKTYSGSIGGYSGGPQITSFCPATGVLNNYSAYVAVRPVSVPTSGGTQHPHGYAATLMAASAMEFLPPQPVTTVRAGSSQEISVRERVKAVVYPGPFKNELHINVSFIKPGNVELLLKDYSGNTIKSMSLGYNNAGTHNYSIQTNIASGPYLLYIIHNNEIINIQKVIRMK